MFKLIAVLMSLTTTLGFGGGASESHSKQNIATAQTEVQIKEDPSEPKILAEGFQSSIKHPFVAVVRDKETYAALVKLDGNLPPLDEEFFRSNVAIAAFLGERNTGGYRVEVTREANGAIRIAEKTPGKGVMVPQMITSPFRLVSVSAARMAPVLVSLDVAWRDKLRPYLVTGGRFTMSGGFAGTSEEFRLVGELPIMREGNLATFIFATQSSGLTKNRSLADVTTGLIQSGGRITINKMSADSAVNAPNSGLKATGEFAAGERKFSLIFTPLPSMIADGYVGQGSLEAELVGSEPGT